MNTNVTFGEVFNEGYSLVKQIHKGNFGKLVQRIANQEIDIPFNSYLLKDFRLKADVPAAEFPPITMDEEIFWWVLYLVMIAPKVAHLTYKVDPSRLHFARLVIDNKVVAVTLQMENNVWVIDSFDFENGFNNTGLWPEGSVLIK